MSDNNQRPLLAAEKLADEALRDLRANLRVKFPDLDAAGADVIMLRVLGKRAGRLLYEADVVEKVVMEAYAAGAHRHHILAAIDNWNPETSGYDPFLPFHSRTTRNPEPKAYDPAIDDEFFADEGWGAQREDPVPISICKLED